MEKYKFELGEKVMIVGCAGMCVIRARGQLEFVEGAERNMYLLGGAQNNYVPEAVLLTIQEYVDLHGKVTSLQIKATP
jgi:hypothetical protein